MIMIIIIIINNNIKIITIKLSSCLMGLFRDNKTNKRDLNSKSPDYKFGAILFFQAASSNCRCNDLQSIPLSR